MPIQYVTDDAGKPTAVIVPIEEWDTLLNKLYAEEPERDDTEYLLKSKTMKKRLLEAKDRSKVKTWEEIQDALSL